MVELKIAKKTTVQRITKNTTCARFILNMPLTFNKA